MEGDGVVLRQWSERDLAQLVTIFDHDEMAYRLPMASPFDLAAAKAYLATARRAREAEARIYLAITSGDDLARGEIMINLAAGTVGYAVGPAYRGRGLAGRALRLITAYAHTVAGLPAVYLEIEADNAGSTAVARSAGFRPTGGEPVFVEDKGRRYALHRWAHTRQPPPRRPPRRRPPAEAAIGHGPAQPVAAVRRAAAVAVTVRTCRGRRCRGSPRRSARNRTRPRWPGSAPG
nr:GNAT family N-acetyltransferase [Micromonospora tarapacensis]